MPKSQKEINTNLLIAIYQNLQTAKQSINNVIDKIKDSKLKKELKQEFKDYDELSESCEDLAKVYEINLVDNNFFKKAKMWFSVNMATLMDRSNRKISSINIIGSTMGVIDLMSVLSDCKRGKPELLTLGRRVLDMEERNIEKLKPYILVDSHAQNQEKEASIELNKNNAEAAPYIEIPSKNNGKNKTKKTFNNKGNKKRV